MRAGKNLSNAIAKQTIKSVNGDDDKKKKKTPPKVAPTQTKEERLAKINAQRKALDEAYKSKRASAKTQAERAGYDKEYKAKRGQYDNAKIKLKKELGEY